jgi:hypothetical protein
MSAQDSTTSHAPWILQQHFDGEINLDEELASRFLSMPVLATVKVRQLDREHAVAALATQDGAAGLRVDVDLAHNSIAFVFSLRSMLALRFVLHDLSENQRASWIDRMRREPDRPMFFWGPTRWNNDYLIAISHQYYTNLYAFSPDGFEAAARITPDVMNQLLDWLADLWKLRRPSDVTLPSRNRW